MTSFIPNLAPISIQDCLRLGLWQIRGRVERKILGPNPQRFELKVPEPVQATSDLSRQFEELGPWHTRFRLGGKDFGGPADYSTDYRFADFVKWHRGGRRVLDVGSFEGMHSFLISELPGVDEVVGLEGREDNLRRANFVRSLLQRDRVSFRLCGVQNLDPTTVGRFDVVFSAGLLYHLPRPWEHLEAIAQISDRLFLSTHYSLTQRHERGGYRGRLYNEFGLKDALSGLDSQSFWPTFGELRRMLRASGFVIRNERHYSKSIHLPLVDLYCEKVHHEN